MARFLPYLSASQPGLAALVAERGFFSKQGKSMEKILVYFMLFLAVSCYG